MLCQGLYSKLQANHGVRHSLTCHQNVVSCRTIVPDWSLIWMSLIYPFCYSCNLVLYKCDGTQGRGATLPHACRSELLIILLNKCCIHYTPPSKNSIYYVIIYISMMFEEFYNSPNWALTGPARSPTRLGIDFRPYPARKHWVGSGLERIWELYTLDMTLVCRTLPPIQPLMLSAKQGGTRVFGNVWPDQGSNPDLPSLREWG